VFRFVFFFFLIDRRSGVRSRRTVRKSDFSSVHRHRRLALGNGSSASQRSSTKEKRGIGLRPFTLCVSGERQRFASPAKDIITLTDVFSRERRVFVAGRWILVVLA